MTIGVTPVTSPAGSAPGALTSDPLPSFVTSTSFCTGREVLPDVCARVATSVAVPSAGGCPGPIHPWSVCSPVTAPATSTTVASSSTSTSMVGVPPMLPVTGAERVHDLSWAAGGFVLLGLATVWVSRSNRISRRFGHGVGLPPARHGGRASSALSPVGGHAHAGEGNHASRGGGR